MSVATSTSRNSETPLPPNFVPGKYDVICGRGKSAWNHPGNQLFRKTIQSKMVKYANAKNKLERTIMVTELIESTQSRGGAGFVKATTNNNHGGSWVIISDQHAREKVGQMFRDTLGGKYRSSFKQKTQRRKEIRAKVCDYVERAIHSNQEVSATICEMRKKFELPENKNLPDLVISNFMLNANSRILESIKQDQSMLHRFHEAASMESTDSSSSDCCESSSTSSSSQSLSFVLAVQ